MITLPELRNAVLGEMKNCIMSNKPCSPYKIYESVRVGGQAEKVIIFQVMQYSRRQSSMSGHSML